eukprot:m.69536 g.69536  ORF g.69536 m.69536 type:complete len:377 (+) comp8591_c0_seq1:62-1192(+)
MGWSMVWAAALAFARRDGSVYLDSLSTFPMASDTVTLSDLSRACGTLMDSPAHMVASLCRAVGVDSEVGVHGHNVTMAGSTSSLPWVSPCAYAVEGLSDRDRMYFVACTCVFSTTTYLALYVYYEILIGKYNLAGLKRYQMIAPERPQPSDALIRKAIRDTAFSHLVIWPLGLFILYPLFRSRLRSDVDELPSVGTFCVQYVCCMLFDDFWFYWVHRLFHEVPWLYRNIHKQHHEFKHTIVVAVEYAHPIEDIFCNDVATIGGPLLLRTHVTVFWFCMCLKYWQSIDAHSGYALPFPWSPWSAVSWMDCAPAHTYHHLETRGNYGGFFTFWDKVCGTYRVHRHHKDESQIQIRLAGRSRMEDSHVKGRARKPIKAS